MTPLVSGRISRPAPTASRRRRERRASRRALSLSDFTARFSVVENSADRIARRCARARRAGRIRGPAAPRADRSDARSADDAATARRVRRRRYAGRARPDDLARRAGRRSRGCATRASPAAWSRGGCIARRFRSRANSAFDAPVICYQGAAIIDPTTDEVLGALRARERRRAELIALAERDRMHLQLYRNDEYYCEARNRFSDLYASLWR